MITIEVSPGELLDKVTILEIKATRIADETKVANVRAELAALNDARRRCESGAAAVTALVDQLRTINERLWDVEDELRVLERQKDFGPRFVALARAVYVTNDERAATKRRINDLLGSELREEKSYQAY